jgi:hypothetical protein
VKGLVPIIGGIILVTAGLTHAQEGQLNGTLGFTFLNSYVWRGFDRYGESRFAMQPWIDFDLFGSGLRGNILVSTPSESGTDLEEARYSLYCDNHLYEGQIYTARCRLGWTYYDYFDTPRETYNMMEVFGSIAWPEVFPLGIVPSYTAIASWPYKTNRYSLARESAGWLHILGLGYDLTLPGSAEDRAEQTLHLSAFLVYNGSAWDFASPGRDGTVDHDWSHSVFGVTTDVDLGNDLALTPGLYYQVSMDDSVNKEDEIWFTLTVTYDF